MSILRDKGGLTEEEFLRTYNADKYPKPSVTADICIIARDGEHDEMLLIRRGGHPFLGHWALPGGFANRNEPLEMTAVRELKEETGITGVHLTLTGVYSKPGRDPRGWTVSAAYTAIVEKSAITVEAGDDAAEARWFQIDGEGEEALLKNEGIVLALTESEEATDRLAFDHTDIISDALCYLASKKNVPTD